jgi:hypothetical protein
VLPLALAALLVTGALAGGWALLTADGDRTPLASPTSPPTEPPSSDPTAEPEPEPQEEAEDPDVERPEGVPADWEQYTHPDQGWTLFHPAAYTVSDRRTLKQFRDESTRYTLRVDYTESPRPSAVQAWQEASASFAQSLTDYQQLRLEPVEFRGYDAADLEFIYLDPGSGAQLRVLDRTFTVDGRAYALYWQVSTDRFEASLEEFERLAAAFVPAP